MWTGENILWIVGVSAYLTIGNMLWNTQYDSIVDGSTDKTYILMLRWVTTLFWLFAVFWVLLNAKRKPRK